MLRITVFGAVACLTLSGCAHRRNDVTTITASELQAISPNVCNAAKNQMWFCNISQLPYSRDVICRFDILTGPFDSACGIELSSAGRKLSSREIRPLSPGQLKSVKWQILTRAQLDALVLYCKGRTSDSKTLAL